MNNEDQVLGPVQVQEDETNFLSPLLTDAGQLASEYRRRRNDHDFKSVHPADSEAEVAKGWIVQRPGKRATRLKRPKVHERLLEDRVWCLFQSMGYSTLNGSNFKITFIKDDNSRGRKQIDVYAEDGETAIVIECKSKAERGRRSLQKDILETVALQSYFRNTIYRRHPNPKPKLIWIYATNNILWSTPDVERAEAHGIKILTENELQYFETFVRHIGPAGKYQILGEFLRGQKVPGLSDVKIPAIRGKIGGETFYSFVTTPRHLQKIAFINHQALNHPDRPTRLSENDFLKQN